MRPDAKGMAEKSPYLGSRVIALRAFRPMRKRERAERHSQDATGDHRHENAAPAKLVGDPAHTGSGDGGAEDITEKTGEARSGSRRLLGHEIERMQADHHDRAIDEEADRDERRVVDPERSVQISPIHEDRDKRESHEQDRRRGAFAFEDFVRDPAARDRSRDR